tara:strand:- start:21 stop:935 length:915 start_codon:yes stop_codon:yes gene_type:complete
MVTDVPTLNGGARGIYGSANQPNVSNQIQYITIPTAGNAIDFGDLTQARGHCGSAASRTRALWGGGATPSKVDTIDYVTFSSTGNATDFGNRTESTAEMDGLGNATRALFCGGYSTGGNPGGYHNRIDYVTMASTGNAVDFGDLVGRRATQGQSGISNSVRGWFMGGQRPDVDNDMIESIVVATTGNAIDWGSNIVDAATNGCPWMSTATHGIGGGASSNSVGSIAKFIFSSHGNTVKWGDLSAVRNMAAGVENSVRGVWGGNTPATTNIEYLSMQTEGNAVDFGDLTGSFAKMEGCSNAHGGL